MSILQPATQPCSPEQVDLDQMSRLRFNGPIMKAHLAAEPYKI